MLKNFPLKWWHRLFIIAPLLAIVVFWKMLSGSTTNPPYCPALDEFHGQGTKNSTTQTAWQQPPPPTPPLALLEPADTEKVAAILGDQNLTQGDAVKRLIEELPRFDTTTQEEAAQHIATLSDDQTAIIWVQKMISKQLPLPAAEILFNNLLTRSEELVLPTLAAIADQPNHPQQSESAQILEPLLGSPKAGFSWKDWLKRTSKNKD